MLFRSQWRELWQDALQEDDTTPVLAHLSEDDRKQVLTLIADFRKELDKRTIGPRGRQVLDHLMPHLSLIASIAVLAYAIIMHDWILTGIAGFALLLLFILRMIIANKAIRHFDDDIAIFKLPFLEYGIIWRNLANKMRYWRADKNDFTSHKL